MSPVMPPISPLEPIPWFDNGADIPNLLFTPLKVGRLTLENRIVVPPMCIRRQLGSASSVHWYTRLARSKPGLLIIEATNIEWLISGMIPLGDLAHLVDAVHAVGGVPIILQLTTLDMTYRAARDLSLQEIEQMPHQYRSAAQICRQAGFDGIELHGAHGYCLNQFFSRLKNTRCDLYGGSLANRMRLGRILVSNLRSILSPDMLLLYRHTPQARSTSSTNTGHEIDYSTEESLTFVNALVEEGLDIIDISPGRAQIPGDLSRPFAEALSIPVITVGGLNDPKWARRVLAEGAGDLVAIGRGVIADPGWVEKVRTGRENEIVACIECNTCMTLMYRGQPVKCERQLFLQKMAVHLIEDYLAGRSPFGHAMKLHIQRDVSDHDE